MSLAVHIITNTISITSKRGACLLLSRVLKKVSSIIDGFSRLEDTTAGSEVNPFGTVEAIKCDGESPHKATDVGTHGWVMRINKAKKPGEDEQLICSSMTPQRSVHNKLLNSGGDN